MARVDYFAIEQAIQTILRADANLSNANIVIEDELTFKRGDNVFIFLETRQPAPNQPLAAGKRTRYHVTFNIMCYHFGLDRRLVFDKRDDLIGHVEIALMGNRTISSNASFSYLLGGDFDSGSTNTGFFAGGEVRLVAEITAIAT